MNSKERVQAALNHQKPDRPPLDLGGAFTTTINVAAYDRLRRALGLPAKDSLLREQTQSVIVDEDVRQALGVDVIGLYERPPLPEREQPDENGNLVSEWGVVYNQAEGSEQGAAYTMVKNPLADATLADLETYPWPDPIAARFEGVAEEAEALRNSSYAVVGNLGWTEIFGVAWYLRSFENFMIDLLQNKEFAHALLRRITNYQKARYARFLELTDDALDVVLFADDVAGQEGLFISPQTYREMIKPYHAELMEWIKAHTKAPVLFHSCGSMLPILDDFVEIGLTILNPVQVSAKGMDTAALKQRYGQQITFWGAIDTHQVLPMGTPDEVQAEVRRRIADLGQEGGYVVAPVHVVQADVPADNIIAMCREATSLK